MRASAVVWLCSLGLLVGCGTSPVIDRNDGQAAEAASSDGASNDSSSVDSGGNDAATTDVGVDAAPSPDATTDSGPVDDGGPCAMGESLCGASCVNLQTSAMNCGMCGRACPSGGSCAMGVCQATCGLAGLPCCVGSVCEEGTTCTAGMCSRAMTPPVYSGASLVNGGSRSNSTSFRMFSTLGQSSQHQQSMSSTNFVLHGGLVGVVGGL